MPVKLRKKSRIFAKGYIRRVTEGSCGINGESPIETTKYNYGIIETTE